MPLFQNIIVLFWLNGFLRTNAKSAGDVPWACLDVQTLGEFPKAVFLNGSVVENQSEGAKDEEKQGRL
ncbi:hypothetical protein BDZ45DRAFT_679819 [Acephala macrosclerotiorum]|nr:hypothetical protein BDZ45DRAFT_679819 [Acephala macrosclerotiorum]